MELPRYLSMVSCPKKIRRCRSLSRRGACTPGPTFEDLQDRAVDAGGGGKQVVLAGRFSFRGEAGSAVRQGNAFHTFADDVGALLLRQAEEVTVEAAPLSFLDAAGSRAAMDRCDPLFAPGGLDPDGSHVHVEDVGLDPALHDRGRQDESLRGQELDQRFGNDAAAHVAAGGARLRKIARLVDVHKKIHADTLGHR
jgi:hypothetical protein